MLLVYGFCTFINSRYPWPNVTAWNIFHIRFSFISNLGPHPLVVPQVKFPSKEIWPSLLFWVSQCQSGLLWNDCSWLWTPTSPSNPHSKLWLASGLPEDCSFSKILEGAGTVTTVSPESGYCGKNQYGLSQFQRFGSKLNLSGEGLKLNYEACNVQVSSSFR